MNLIAERRQNLVMQNHMPDQSPLQIILEGKIFEEQPLGGISRIYHEILPRICDMDQSILFYIFTAGHLMQPLPMHDQIAHNASDFSAHHFLRPQTIFWKLQDYLRAKLQIASFNPGRNTIWHTTYFQLPNWWTGPKITTVYDLIPEKFSYLFNKNYDEIFRKRKKRAVSAADKVICISESVRSDVIEMYDLLPERVVAIPLACGDNFRQMTIEEIPLEFRVDRPFILYVGMRNHYKNFSTLWSAYSSWARRNEIDLLVVGSPWLKEEEEAIVTAALESNVVFRSDISDEELCSLYNQALAFVYPSLSEGFGIPLLEAMACGCPIVASRISTFVEVAGDAPYYFDPVNKDELIAALEAACLSEKPRSRRDDILTKYSWDRTARATLDIYRELALCT